MKLQENEFLGKRSQDTCAMRSPSSAQHSFNTDKDGEERCSGTERLFNTIRRCSSPDLDGVLWYDSGNYSGVTGGFWSINHTPLTPRQSSNAFLTEGAEEEFFTALRGHLMHDFGIGRRFGRRFSFREPDPQPLELFKTSRGNRVLAQLRSVVPFVGSSTPITSPTCSEAPRLLVRQ
ncbi:hypothetical protein MRX96_007987 [Rhipicephalus microplus]